MMVCLLLIMGIIFVRLFWKKGWKMYLFFQVLFLFIFVCFFVKVLVCFVGWFCWGIFRIFIKLIKRLKSFCLIIYICIIGLIWCVSGLFFRVCWCGFVGWGWVIVIVLGWFLMRWLKMVS